MKRQKISLLQIIAILPIIIVPFVFSLVDNNPKQEHIVNVVYYVYMLGLAGCVMISASTRSFKKEKLNKSFIHILSVIIGILIWLVQAKVLKMMCEAQSTTLSGLLGIFQIFSSRNFESFSFFALIDSVVICSIPIFAIMIVIINVFKRKRYTTTQIIKGITIYTMTILGPMLVYLFSGIEPEFLAIVVVTIMAYDLVSYIATKKILKVKKKDKQKQIYKKPRVAKIYGIIASVVVMVIYIGIQYLIPNKVTGIEEEFLSGIGEKDIIFILTVTVLPAISELLIDNSNLMKSNEDKKAKAKESKKNKGKATATDIAIDQEETYIGTKLTNQIIINVITLIIILYTPIFSQILFR